MRSYNEILMFLLFVHIIGQFYCPMNVFNYFKEKSMSNYSNRCIDYILSSLLFMKLICPNLDIFLFIPYIAIYCLLENLKDKFIRLFNNYYLVVVQVIYVLSYMIISYFVIKFEIYYEYNPIIKDMLVIMGSSIESVISILVKVLLIHIPTNQIISSIMIAYKSVDGEETNTMKIGRMIGTMERCIMLFFISMQQYSSIGFILTAKSVARYNKINDNQAFAEYYLLGTLLSTMCVLCVSFV